MKISGHHIGRVAAILLCTTSASAFAQPAPAQKPAAEEGAGSGLQEIVVTARRRSENIQNVPTTIQAISSQALIQRGIRNEADLQTAAPGLVIRAGQSQNQINYVIRGESAEPYSGSVAGVQPYIDEVAIGNNASTAFYDFENVQVLKGPQGTLFGRNSTGGAVLYQTTKPKDQFGGYGSVQYGNLKKFIIEGAVNAPLVEDKVLLRLAGTYSSGGAFVHNLYNGRTLGDTKVRSGRVSLTLKPTEKITNEFMGQYGKFTGTNNGTFLFSTTACGDPAFPSPGSPVCFLTPSNPFNQALLHSPPGTYVAGYPNGTIYGQFGPGLTSYLRSKGKYVVENDAPDTFHATDVFIANTTTFEVLDNLILKNVFGYGRTKRGFAYDNDASGYPLLEAGGGAPGGGPEEVRKNRNITDEFQVQGKAFDNKLSYIVGLFYSDVKVENISPLHTLVYLGGTAAIDFPFLYKNRTSDKTKAVFTQETYALTDKINLTGGIRYTWDTLRLTQDPQSTLLQPSVPYLQAKQHDVSWTASIDYKPVPELMVYATTRGSWRVGGYNPFAQAPAIPPGGDPGQDNYLTSDKGGTYFPEERVRDVELGAKYNGHLAGVPYRLNVDIYQAWITNVQKTAYGLNNIGTATSFTVIVPAAKVSGIEADGEIVPTDWLHIGASGAYTDARYTKNMVRTAGGSINTFGPFADSPKLSGTVFAEATDELGDAGSLVFHVDAYGQSSFHISSLGNTLNPYDQLPGYVLLNGRLDWRDPMGVKGLTASVFGKNITNRRYFIGGSGGIQLFSENTVTFGQPRTFGGVLRYSF
jgi:iron complex outermembrane receptor protein